MNAPPSALRLAASAPVAALSLLAGFHALPILLPGFDLLPLLCVWLAVALLLAWLLAPMPWGGGASVTALLTPDREASPWLGLAIAVAGAMVFGLVGAGLTIIAEDFDLDRSVDPYERRPAMPRDLATGFGLALGFAAFHALYTLGWVIGAEIRARRDSFGCVAACGVTIGYLTLAFAAAGLPGFGFAISALLVCPLTLLMAIPVLLGGRVWHVILCAAIAGTLPMAAIGVRDYP